jgi:hypothetical protein
VKNNKGEREREREKKENNERKKRKTFWLERDFSFTTAKEKILDLELRRFPRSANLSFCFRCFGANLSQIFRKSPICPGSSFG